MLEVDRSSRAARIQAGALGLNRSAAQAARPDAAALSPELLFFHARRRWIATRAGGHYAMQHTHIDDFVENTRLVTPPACIIKNYI